MGQKANILIIEDNQEVEVLLRKTLEGIGYRVWVVKQPKKALELLNNIGFPVVITEMRSAKMNGIETTEAVHKISPKINVIILTFYSFISSAIEAMEAGAYGYITKPLNTSEIRIVVERAVETFFLLSSDGEKQYYADLAVYDGLTNLHNRRYFDEVIDKQFKQVRLQSSFFSVLMIDIDNFKEYNDTKGHPAGDELLRKLAKVFKKAMRDKDSVCRYGGEEFVAILPQTDKKSAEIVAERLRKQVQLYVSTTVSIGIASFPDDAKDSIEIIKKADSALYKAKQTGKNKYCVA